MDEKIEAPSAVQERTGEWVFLEVMGHRCHYGLLSEVERFGSKLARIDVFATGDAEPRETHLYGGPAIFSITPATEEVCRKQSDPYEYRTARLTYEQPTDDDAAEEEPF